MDCLCNFIHREFYGQETRQEKRREEKEEYDDDTQDFVLETITVRFIRLEDNRGKENTFKRKVLDDAMIFWL